MTITDKTLKTRLELTQEHPTQDAMAKFLLSNKTILALILKYTVEEFGELSPKDIIPYLGTTVKGGSDTPAVTVVGTEDILPGIGRIFHDGMTTAAVPSDRSQYMYINTEPHNAANKNVYEILPRAEYSKDWVIVSQGNRDFSLKDQEYDKLHKVCCIWIMFKAARWMGDNIARNNSGFRLEYGNDPKLKKYDRYTGDIVLIFLAEEDNEKKKDDIPLYRMLRLIFLSKLDIEEKVRILEEEFDVKLNEEEKEMMDMMGELGRSFYDSGRAEGRAEGIEKGEKRGIKKGEKRGIKKGRAEERKARNNELLLEIMDALKTGEMTLETASRLMKMSISDLKKEIDKKRLS